MNLDQKWNPVPLELPANKEKEHIIQSPGTNVIYLVNNSEFTVYIDLNRAQPDHYEEVAPGQGKAVLVRKSEIKSVKLYATGEAYVIVHEIEEVDPRVFILLQSISGNVNIETTPGLKAAELNLDEEKDVQVDIKTLPAVDINDLPPVDINSIPDIIVNAMPDNEFTWLKVTAGAGGDQTVKASAGLVAKVYVEGAITVYLKDDTVQAWAAGNHDFSKPLKCNTNIKLNFSAAGTAWILYK